MGAYQSLEACREEKFPDSRREAYYRMWIHDHLAPILAPAIRTGLVQGVGTGESGME
jgi:hypothetical protein